MLNLNANRNAILVLMLSALLSACGFHLRGDTPLAFKSAYVSGSTVINVPLKKHLSKQGVTVLDNAETAELQVELIKEENERRILSLNGSGAVSEYEFYYRVHYRTKLSSDELWSTPLTMEARRDLTYKDADVLAKQAEEKLLVKDMRTEVLNGVVRRISALKK